MAESVLTPAVRRTASGEETPSLDAEGLLARINDIAGQVSDYESRDLHLLFNQLAELARRFVTEGGEDDPAKALVCHALIASVLRPLADAMGDAAAHDAGAAVQGVHLDSTSTTAHADLPDDQLWNLTQTATRLRARPDSATGLIEAVAGLQRLALRSSAVRPARLSTLRDLHKSLRAEIRSSLDGPYLVTNASALTDHLGVLMLASPQMALCRCGQSASKPFCDGSHARTDFAGAKDPNRVPNQRDTYVGQQITVLDNRGICAHSGLCTDRLAAVFHADAEPFVTPSGGRMDEIIRAVRACPSGALSLALDGEEIRAHVDLRRPARIEVSKDGPYRVTGGIPLVDAAGNPELRVAGASSEHFSLCRCGHSRNKPFCSGMHWYVAFRDPVQAEDPEVTLFEWCGGFPALLRMTKLFYEKHIPADPILAPVFATMSADHPERVAAWLGEVFGGPTSYSAVYGGYTRMIAKHLGKEITEEKRSRWVELLQRSAAEAGMPNDAEFRSVFASYIEWGSRLAVENSQQGARPPEQMPMPHWDWNTAAGPPGSRVSAVAALAQDEPPVVLPRVGEPVSFALHIRGLFRKVDRQSMQFAFDLWSLDDVVLHSAEILLRLTTGSMPCDGAWPSDRMAVFQRWVESGMAE